MKAMRELRSRLRWGAKFNLAHLGVLGLSLLSGCAQFMPEIGLDRSTTIRGVPPEAQVRPVARAQAVLGEPRLPEQLNMPEQTKILPISLDTVFRLTQDQNGQIALGREKLNESYATQDLAGKRWLPDIFVGTSFYRHEGGIQDFQGNLVHSSYGALLAGVEINGKLDLREAAYKKIEAERMVWQRRGELSKLTSENMLDASTTFIDFLAARTGEIIGDELEKRLNDLRSRARKLADIDPGLRVEVSRIDSEVQAQKQITRKLHEGANSAGAKLVYLLGLGTGTELVPVDRQMMMLNLVDYTLPATVLTEQALTRGPGVRELEGLLKLIEDARAKASGPGRFMPIFEINMLEGAFGAGPGDSMRWDNRWDMGLHARWNLTQCLTGREQRRVVDAKIHQAQLTYQDLRAKLTLGVAEAREASNSSKEQIRLGEMQIKSAEEAYQLSDYRLKNAIKGASPSEVLLSLRALVGARLGYLNAIRELDKAQLRLFVLVGAAGENKE